MTLRAGGYQGPASVHTRAMRTLGRETPGFSLLEDITADGSPATALLRRVESGALDLCCFASSYLASRVPALLAFDIPFAFADRAAAYRALDGALGRLIAAQVAEQTGFTLLAFWDNGFRHLSNRMRPIVQSNDCRGMTIRTLDIRAAFVELQACAVDQVGGASHHAAQAAMGLLDHDPQQVGEHLGGPVAVGVGQAGPRCRTSAQVIQPVGVALQAGLDVAQARSSRHLGVDHRDQMAAVAEAARELASPCRSTTRLNSSQGISFSTEWNTLLVCGTALLS